MVCLLPLCCRFFHPCSNCSNFVLCPFVIIHGILWFQKLILSIVIIVKQQRQQQHYARQSDNAAKIHSTHTKQHWIKNIPCESNRLAHQRFFDIPVKENKSIDRRFKFGEYAFEWFFNVKCRVTCQTRKKKENHTWRNARARKRVHTIFAEVIDSKDSSRLFTWTIMLTPFLHGIIRATILLWQANYAIFFFRRRRRRRHTFLDWIAATTTTIPTAAHSEMCTVQFKC